MPQNQSLTSAVHRQFRTPWIAVGMGIIYGAGLAVHLAFFFTGYRNVVAPFTNPVGAVAFVASIALVVRARKQIDAENRLSQHS